jgi:hypothetical protein
MDEQIIQTWWQVEDREKMGGGWSAGRISEGPSETLANAERLGFRKVGV